MTQGANGDARAISLIESLLRSRGSIAPELADARTIESIVRARCAAGAAESIGAYARRLETDVAEADRLISEIAVPETWFFRYRRSFELLRTMLQERARDPSRRVRLLSVGCAGGCEPVSIAITAMAAGITAERIEVIAVDRNPGPMEDARRGCWPAHSLREGLPDWSAPWIGASPEGAPDVGASRAHVAPSVLERIAWRVSDATAESACEPGTCDAVFCRNVLIYLDTAARHAMMARLTAALAPGGTLFLGHAESMAARDGLESAGITGAFAWRRASATAGLQSPRTVGITAAPAQPAARMPVRPAMAGVPVPHLALRTAAVACADQAAEPMQAEPDPSAPERAGIAAAQQSLAQGDREGARSSLLRICDAISRGGSALHADDMEHAAGLLCSIGELDAAFGLYSRIAFVNPASDRALLAMAEIAESLGRADEAARLRDRLRRLAARQAAEDRA